ncbi:snurportin-1 [Impatiens glandulifera]|uniref:snurportin-1 n=1 Tax=Impatiens glandulifera TaxID=253017 RepID=UPI001FB0B261|nr:snurportin-1 [Impatiens glandulifera]
MAPHELRRPFKRPAISDQQKRRDLSLIRQEKNRLDAQRHARFLASTVLSLQPPADSEIITDSNPSPEQEFELVEEGIEALELDVRQAAKLKGTEARRWFAKQLMLPEWMIDIPDRLCHDWYVLARPAGKRCFVVSSNGTTVSRLRNGTLLHRFPSSLPSGARNKGNSSSQSYCILDCIFHELDQTYYVTDMVCWAGFSLYECTAEFRFFWLNSKLVETGACDPPSVYHKHRFSLPTVYNCDQAGLHASYTQPTSYVKDGLLFYNKHAHYQTGNTPLALVWKDANCSQYVIDTDSKGQILDQQQVVLALQENGKLTTSDEPPVEFGCLDMEFIQKSGLQTGDLLKFSVSDRGLCFTDGKLEKADIQFISKSNRARAFADSFSKIMFQHMVRHSPLQIEDLFASITSSAVKDKEVTDEEMAD